MNKQQIKRIEETAKAVFALRKKDILKNLNDMERNIYKVNEELRLKGVPLAERKKLIDTAKQKRIDEEKIYYASAQFSSTHLYQMMFEYWELFEELDTFEARVKKIVWYKFDLLVL